MALIVTLCFSAYGTRPIGYKDGTSFKIIPEMIPEIVVPDLTGFKASPQSFLNTHKLINFHFPQLKPYVSYKVEDIVTPPMTPEELFGAIYVQKITEDFAKGKLGPNGEPLEPSPEEKLSGEEAKERALRIKTDII